MSRLRDSLPPLPFSRASRKARPSVADKADETLDKALQRLTDATASNVEMCQKISYKRRTRRLRLVTPSKANGVATCVLFVDDDPVILRSVVYILDTHFEILTAESGAIALQMLEENPGRVDLIVSDQRMPDMTGDQLLKKCRSRWPSIPRLLMSAYHDIEALHRAVNHGGISAVVPKPFNQKDLVSVIEKAVEPVMGGISVMP